MQIYAMMHKHPHPHPHPPTHPPTHTHNANICTDAQTLDSNTQA